jgi:hypothetical protein
MPKQKNLFISAWTFPNTTSVVNSKILMLKVITAEYKKGNKKVLFHL